MFCDRRFATGKGLSTHERACCGDIFGMYDGKYKKVVKSFVAKQEKIA
jgi:hypothetical protein